MGKALNYTREDLINNLKEVNRIYGYISKETINKHGVYGDWIYYNNGGIKQLMIESNINIEENKKKRNKTSFSNMKKYSREYLIDKMKEYISLYGIPKTREFNKKEGYPTLYAYRREFGSFKNAIKECGFELDEKTKILCDRRKYEKEELLNILKIETENKLKTDEIGLLLTNNEIDLNKNMPSSSSYVNRFGGIIEAYKELGIDYYSFNDIKIKEDMKKKYLEIKELCGQVPNSRILDKYSLNNNRYYASSTYIHHFGNIEKLQLLMGDVPTNYSRNMTNEEMLNGLLRLNNELGIVPTQKEVACCDYCASVTEYTKRFGSFVEAIYKSGLTPRSEKKILRTENGNLALSGYEFKFLKMLEKYNIEFNKEERYKKYIRRFNKGYKFDFTLHINNKVLFVEIFGITGNKNYDNKTKEKIQLCKDNNLNLLALYPKDIINNNFEQMIEIINNKLNER